MGHGAVLGEVPDYGAVLAPTASLPRDLGLLLHHEGCDPDATDDEDDNLVGSVLTSVGGSACRRGASQLPYISGSDFDVS